MLVPAHQTPLDEQQTYEQFGRAWVQKYGAYPHPDCIRVLLAQTWMETGGVHCYNFNVGNVKQHGALDSMQLRTREVIDGQDVMMTCTFAAFNSLEEGCFSQIDFLDQHYPSCLQAAAAGDPVAFASAAKAHGYFTADLGQYQRGMHSWFVHFSTSLRPAQWEIDAGAPVDGYGLPMGT